MGKKRLLIRTNEQENDKVLEEFLNHCKAKNLRESTVNGYRLYISAFVRWLPVPLASITQETIEEYCVELQGRMKDVSVATSIRQVRAFLYYCMRRGLVPKFKVEVPRADEPYKEPYTEEEIVALTKEPTSNSFVEWRTYTFICFMFDTGCRLSTALATKVKDIDFAGGYIHLAHTKNRKNQFIPLSSELNKRLKKWIAMAGLGEEDYLFLNSYCEENAPISKRTIEQQVADYNNSRNVKRTSIHLMRHTFAKNYLKNGGNPAMLQRILGHSSLATTNRYVLMYGVDLKDGFDNFTIL